MNVKETETAIKNSKDRFVVIEEIKDNEYRICSSHKIRSEAITAKEKYKGKNFIFICDRDEQPDEENTMQLHNQEMERHLNHVI
jgi:hypothetical protein